MENIWLSFACTLNPVQPQSNENLSIVTERRVKQIWINLCSKFKNQVSNSITWWIIQPFSVYLVTFTHMFVFARWPWRLLRYFPDDLDIYFGYFPGDLDTFWGYISGDLDTCRGIFQVTLTLVWVFSRWPSGHPGPRWTFSCRWAVRCGSLITTVTSTLRRLSRDTWSISSPTGRCQTLFN